MELDLIRKFSDNEKPIMELNEQKRHEYHLIGREKKMDGHTLFSFNTITKEVKRAEVKVCKDVDFVTRQAISNPKVVVEKDCIYLQALNKKNFIKILKREGYL